jgi:two-component system osmolarity sensor histidine kinase EnvZ
VIKKYLPRSLLGRSLLIIVIPLILLQVVSGLIFYESHWDKVSLRLARGVAGDVATIVDLLHEDPSLDGQNQVFNLAARNLDITGTLKPKDIVSNKIPVGRNLMERMLIRALQEAIQRPFQIDTGSLKKHVIVQIQLQQGILEVVTSRKRLFSSTTYVFVLWMVGTSLLLFAVATIFMRNQVKSIQRLAAAADDFGKGREGTDFKMEGASEVRQAAHAFLIMRERILRQVGERTKMLAGVSHDLRTPLTRMKLQMALLGEQDGVEDLKGDVDEMEHMLEGYLAFARGEGAEVPQPANLSSLLDEVVMQSRRKGGEVDFHSEGEISLHLSRNAFKRGVINLIDNAIRYAGHVSVRAGQRGDHIDITIDDDGPGIPEDQRDDAFKPFHRLEGSRNPSTGGVGLGLTIARDVIRSHGGSISLEESPLGGLRVRLRLPI